MEQNSMALIYGGGMVVLLSFINMFSALLKLNVFFMPSYIFVAGCTTYFAVVLYEEKLRYMIHATPQ
jgi:hypothetical protein